MKLQDGFNRINFVNSSQGLKSELYIALDFLLNRINNYKRNNDWVILNDIIRAQFDKVDGLSSARDFETMKDYLLFIDSRIDLFIEQKGIEE